MEAAEDNRTMRAGRDLDLIISSEVLGYSTVKQKNGGYVEGTPGGTRPLPSYSKQIEAAWEVARRYGITLIPINDGSWFAMKGPREASEEGGQAGWENPAEFLKFLQSGEFTKSGAAVADNAALAICLAAYTALQKKRAVGE